MDDKNLSRPLKSYNPESEVVLHYKNKKKTINLIMGILVVASLVLTVYAMLNYSTFYQHSAVNWVVPLLVNASTSFEKATLLVAVGTALISGLFALVCLILWFVFIWRINMDMINKTDAGLSHYVSQSASNARIDKALEMSDDAISVYSTNKKVTNENNS